MMDPIVVARAGDRLRFFYPDPPRVRDIAWDALLTAGIHVRKNLPPRAAECYDEPTVQEVVELFYRVAENLATAALGGYFHLPVRTSDVAGWMLPAILQVGLARGGFDVNFVWPDGRPIAQTFTAWIEKGLLT